MTATADLLASATSPSAVPWITVAPGVSSKPLAFFRENEGWVSLLRLEPGASIPPHRHRGEVHGYVLAGHRRVGEHGRILGPGDYEYEPAGSVDTWAVEGEEPLVSLFVVRGAVEYLGPDGQVLRRETASTKAEAHRLACAERGLTPLDLWR